MPKPSSESPIDDLTFDVLTVLREKAQALAAYEKYLGDANAEDDDELHDLFVEMRKQDEEHVLVLKEVLARRLEDDLADEDADDDDDDDDELDDIEDLVEGYEDQLDEEVEVPSSVAAAPPGDDPAAAGSAPPSSRRGESTERHR